ncbi:hypothetical protein [Endothiovibrio diazotrophicus]
MISEGLYKLAVLKVGIIAFPFGLVAAALTWSRQPRGNVVLRRRHDAPAPRPAPAPVSETKPATVARHPGSGGEMTSGRGERSEMLRQIIEENVILRAAS